MQLQSVDKVAERATEQRDYDQPKRWGRRLLLAFVLTVLLLVGGFWGWTSYGRRELDRQVAEYRAAGEPVELVDFIVKGVADHENAAIPLREAADIDTKSEAWQKYEAVKTSFELPLTDNEIAAIRHAVAANAPAFELVDEAMRLKKLDWKIPYSSPAIQVLLPDLSKQRQLAMLIVNRAKLNYQQGDHAAAVADVRRAMFIGRAIGEQPFLVSHLVSVGINANASNALMQMSPELKVGNGAGQVREAELRALVAQLLDDQPQRAGYRHGLQGERAMQLDTARCIASGRLSLAQLAGAGGAPASNPLVSAATFVVKPIALSDGLLMIRHTTALSRAFESSPDWPTYKQVAPPFPAEVEDAKVRHLLAKVLLPSFERAAMVNFRHMADRRMTAIALAARAYAVEHDGKLPEKLDDLVPKYLPAVPLDPFAPPAPSPQPLKYVNDPDKPIVYSVGEDGQDAGGSELPTSKAKMNPGRWDRLDIVLHLKLQPRELPEDEAEE